MASALSTSGGSNSELKKLSIGRANAVNVVTTLKQRRDPMGCIVGAAKERQLDDDAAFAGLSDKIFQAIEVGLIPLVEIEFVAASAEARFRASSPWREV